MNINEWNNILWALVENDLCRANSKLYLAFDESMLSDAIHQRDIDVSPDGVLSDLNRMMLEHCRPMDNGFIGLSEKPNERPIRDNWSWVWKTQSSGRSLSLTFAVHQILTAEMMHGVSFYAAYWEALGIEPEEDRINPFGDRGSNSFRRLWSKLKQELLDTLPISDEDITFHYGSGPSKYRNLPISQSLLNQRDLESLAKEMSNVDSLDDDHVYARMTRVRLSPSGTRKVILGALKKSLVRQFRDFASAVNQNDHSQNIYSQPTTRVAPGVSELVLYEEQEVFGESLVHCTTADGVGKVPAILIANFQRRQHVVFRREDYYAKPSEKSSLPDLGEEVWIILLANKVDSFLNLYSPVHSDTKLSDYFAEVPSSLPSEFRVVHCLSTPIEFANTVITSDGLMHNNVGPSDQFLVSLAGGICVNLATSHYLCGFGPHTVFLDGESIDGSVECRLDYETSSLDDAMDSISNCKLPRMHVLEVKGVAKRISFVNGSPRERLPTAFISKWSLVPAQYANKRLNESLPELECVLDAFDHVNAATRERIIRRLSGELMNENFSWCRADSSSTGIFRTILGYLNLPIGLHSIILNRIINFGLVPEPLIAAIR